MGHAKAIEVCGGMGSRACELADAAHCLPESKLRRSWDDTFHSSSQIAGSAVQFNSNVSAMPPDRSGQVGRLACQGTADTLLLR